MKKAVVTGANRGIGLGFVKHLKHRGYYVVGCCRQPEQADELTNIADEMYPLDIRQDRDIVALQNHLKGQPVDLLINNAGISGEQGVTVGNIHRDNFHNVLDVNCVGTILLTDALLDNLQLSQDKYVLVVSSRMGSIADNDRGRSYAYRTSKAALNCVMRSFAIDVEPVGVKVMLIHPGWVNTDMGGEQAQIDVKTSVKGMLEQMDAHMDSSHAETLRRFDGNTIPW